ncbi:MAG TPA: hypothetical protein VKO16_03400, partial [Polyangia bacterium]|nr:hypothetical protein [Polyangia bacterium]
MTHTRVISSSVVASVGLWVLTVVGCTSPARTNPGNPGTAGTTGTSGQGSGGSGNSSGVAGTNGSGGNSSGGQGGDIVILSGNGGSTGSGAGTTGTGSGGMSSTGTAGAAGGPAKMACASATSDPLPYTSGYTADATNRSNAMTTASGVSTDEKAQQMSGLLQSGTASYNVFNQDTNTNRGIRGFYYRDGPRGVNLNAT